MAERWQTSEARSAAVFFRDSSGNPVTGLTPTATSNYKDGTAGAPAATVTEVGNGFYRVGLASAPTKDVLVRVDGGGTLSTTRYVPLEIPVGGYVDNVDAATSSRASAAALATVQADTDDLQSSMATLLSRLTATRAALLDSLVNLDAAISSRATHAEATSDTPGTATLLGRLTAFRAALLDQLAYLDVAVSTRATAADLQVTVSAAPTISTGP